MGSGSGHPRGDASPLTLKGQAHICGSSANGHGRARVSGWPRGRSSGIHGPEGLEWQNRPRTGGPSAAPPAVHAACPPFAARGAPQAGDPTLKRGLKSACSPPPPPPGRCLLLSRLHSSVLHTVARAIEKAGDWEPPAASHLSTRAHAAGHGPLCPRRAPRSSPQVPPSALLVGVSAQGPAPRPPPAHLRSRARSPPPRGAGPRPGGGCAPGPLPPAMAPERQSVPTSAHTPGLLPAAPHALARRWRTGPRGHQGAGLPSVCGSSGVKGLRSRASRFIYRPASRKANVMR